MIAYYSLYEPSLVLKSDLAGEFPLYIYWPQDQSTLLYTTSITELLNDARVPKPLKVSNEGLSFLLQSGVVPPPKTAYQDIYILGIGDKAKVKAVNGKVQVEFSHDFPFINANRLQAGEMQPEEDLILQMLAEATISRIDESKPTFLFHSAGKDSNSIALALAEAGWQDKVTLITHKSKGKADESDISAKIAKQLGFKHQVLHEVDQLQDEHHQAIEDFFINAPFPCTDNVTLAYPLYAHQLPELKGANIIDGGMNDRYMVSPPTARELKVMPLSKLTHHASFLRHFAKSESLLSPLIRTPAEWMGGTSGLSFADTKKILPDAVNVYPHWQQESQLKKDWDLFDFKTAQYTAISTEMFQRKARNFADSINSNLVLPFANQQVAEYFGRLPEAFLFDRKNLRNKLILRKMLKERVGIDSDALGKLGFTYDAQGLVLNNLEKMTSEISFCPLWTKDGLSRLLLRFMNQKNKFSREGIVCRNYIYRLFLISSWFSCSKYFN